MNLLEKFKTYINKQHLFQPKDKLLLAVSGGVDSVVLCELCKQADFDFVIAHCNFQLRGEESSRDEAFVKSLGKKYDVEVLIKTFDTEKYATENKCSTQVAARELRYQWFAELVGNRQLAMGNGQLAKGKKQLEIGNRRLAKGNRQSAKGNEQLEKGNKQMTKGNSSPDTHCPLPIADFLLTAHHANDNIETLLMNFFKGTGIGGLHGILPKQGNIIRPLLFAKKEELTAFATANNLSFVEDSSNALDKYTRNYFRNQLIPDLQKVFPQVEENLLHNIGRFREIELLYLQSVNAAKKNLLESKGNELHIPVLKLQKTVPLKTIVYEIIKDYGFTAHQTEEVVGLLAAETGKFIQSSTHRIIKNRNWLIIAPIENTEAENILIEKEGGLIEFRDGKLKLEILPTCLPDRQAPDSRLTTQASVAQLNAAEIKFPLLLRKWKQGDYFYPLGMTKKKKLNRFFNDLKLSVTQKEKTWVIEMDKKIIWVVGHRVDNRFKITPNTKEILQVTFTVAE